MRLGIANKFAQGLAICLLLALLVAGCDEDRSSEQPVDERGKVRVVATLPLFSDLIKQVGGIRVTVFAIFSSGADPHTFEPTPRDIEKVTDAELVIVNGRGLEASALKVIRPNVDGDATMVSLADVLMTEGVLATQPALANDPHLWLNVDNARGYIRLIRDALSRIDPDGFADYESNYQRYLAALDDMEQYIRLKVSAVPPQNRALASTHDAFSHLASYLGFREIGSAVTSPGQEPSPSHITDLITQIRAAGVPAVFAEPQLNSESDVLREAASAAGAKVCVLYSDTLDERVRTYVEIMRFNAEEIARCLGGAANG